MDMEDLSIHVGYRGSKHVLLKTKPRGFPRRKQSPFELTLTAAHKNQYLMKTRLLYRSSFCFHSPMATINFILIDYSDSDTTTYTTCLGPRVSCSSTVACSACLVVAWPSVLALEIYLILLKKTDSTPYQNSFFHKPSCQLNLLLLIYFSSVFYQHQLSP